MIKRRPKLTEVFVLEALTDRPEGVGHEAMEVLFSDPDAQVYPLAVGLGSMPMDWSDMDKEIVPLLKKHGWIQHEPGQVAELEGFYHKRHWKPDPSGKGSSIKKTDYDMEGPDAGLVPISSEAKAIYGRVGEVFKLDKNVHKLIERACDEGMIDIAGPDLEMWEPRLAVRGDTRDVVKGMLGNKKSDPSKGN